MTTRCAIKLNGISLSPTISIDGTFNSQYLFVQEVEQSCKTTIEAGNISRFEFPFLFLNWLRSHGSCCKLILKGLLK